MSGLQLCMGKQCKFVIFLLNRREQDSPPVQPAILGERELGEPVFRKVGHVGPELFGPESEGTAPFCGPLC